jgi:hypothetical protein
VNTLYTHNQAAEHTIAMRELVTTINSVLRNKELQDTIGSINPQTLNWFRNYLTDVARGKMPPPDDAFVAGVRLLRNNIRAMWVGVNLSAWLKTQTPLISAAQDIPNGALLGTLTNPLAARSNWKFAKSKSKYMAGRPKTLRIEITEVAAMKDQFARQAVGKKSVVQKGLQLATEATSAAQEFAYAIFTPLDLVSTSAAWVGKYKMEINEHGDDALAIARADKGVRTHFPSGRLDELPAMFRSGGYQREFTVFTADMNRMYNLGYSAIQLKERRVQAAFAFAFYSVMASALFLAATDVRWDMLREALGIKD